MSTPSLIHVTAPEDKNFEGRGDATQAVRSEFITEDNHS
jgi:hypothetical protein